MTADFPAAWQMRDLEGVIDVSPLSRDDFEYSRGGGYESKADLRISHTGYEKAAFAVEWYRRRPAPGVYGRAPAIGEYFITMAPGADGPRDESHGVTWTTVVAKFRDWVSYLGREFEAREDWGPFAQIRRMPPPSPPGADQFDDGEIEIIEPLLLNAGEELVRILDVELVTKEDLEEELEWVRSEFADVRSELKRQSKKGFRRTIIGSAGNMGMRYAPGVWEKMAPVLECILKALDQLPPLLPPG